jgi:hypothetical protein
VCLLLGCYSPIILRAVNPGRFQVVSEAYIHGLEDAKGILGPLPPGWRVIYTVDALGRQLHRYIDVWTKRETADDPRLHILPSEWHRVAHERSADDAGFLEMFRNHITGEMINFDPRLTAKSLTSQGVSMSTLRLV